MAGNIPKEMQDTYDTIASLITDFSKQYLDEDYEALCLHALEKLCRKRPSPLKSGRAKTWACGIIYAIGSNNFIFDRSMKVHLTAAQIVEPFGIAKTTAQAKASDIRKMLKITYSNAEWCLPSLIDSNPEIWTVLYNGFAVDARWLPRELQIICYEKGLIPYVPGLKEPKDPE